MNKGSALETIIETISLCAIAACTKKMPSQIICRFNDNRYLELIDYDYEGYVVYHDIKRKIQESTYDDPIYRIFSSEFIHPSGQYILMPEWESGTYKISKNHGQTWQVTKCMASFPALGRNSDGVIRGSPEGKKIKRVMVVSNQAFIPIVQGHLYVSSYPFGDPRLAPGGPDINCQYFNDTYYLYRPGEHKSGDEYVNDHMKPESPGHAWGTMVFMKASLAHLTEGYKANYQNLPDKESEVMGYEDWTRMHCDMDTGK